jgi:4a-hydroxytetrahydrobiopterin dehydratase
MSTLSEDQISVYMHKLPDWNEVNNTLEKTYEFAEFKDSIRFVNQAAELAESANHHPDLLIQYNKVKVTLTTHDQNGITGKDFLLAEQIENL